MTAFRRVFHPVGHGAFTTEHLADRGVYANLVFDCGTQNTKMIVNSCIDDAFDRGDAIDLLVISHFDKDHISGIPHLKEYCNIKRVLIPYLDYGLKCFFIGRLGLDPDVKELQNLIWNPEDYFKGSVVIFVTPDINEEPEPPESDNESVVFIGQGLSRLSGQIKSGTRIREEHISDIYKDKSWVIVPYNYITDELKTIRQYYETNYGKFRRPKPSLENALGFLGPEELTDCVKIYKNLDSKYKKRSNDMSLMVYSGFYPPTRGVRYRHYGCLYLGDIGLKNPDICSKVLTMYDMYLKDVHTVQIPHHGSPTSYNPTFWETIRESREEDAVVGVVCHKKVSDKHPDGKVIINILTHDVFVRSVTEEKTSLFTQYKFYI